MKIKIKNSKKFFDEMLNKEGMSLRKFSKSLRIGYSNIKRYRRGESTIPQDLFDKLIKHSLNKKYWLKNLKKLNDNWGRSKGGKISSIQENRTKILKYARSFRKIRKVIIKQTPFFCEFYGALLGDGCICKFKKSKENYDRFLMVFSVNKNLDSNYLKKLKYRIKKEFNLHSYYYEYKNKNVCVLVINNKGLCLDLNKRYGVPIGEKYEKLKISNKILSLPWRTKKFFLRGLFDTDGCIVANKREDYRYPWIVITSKNVAFLNHLKKILRKHGYPAYITGTDVCVRGINNVKRWFNDIGSSNNRNILKYKYFLKYKRLPANIWANSLMAEFTDGIGEVRVQLPVGPLFLF